MVDFPYICIPVIVLCILVVLILYATAPVGYEDDSFHYGRKDE